MINIRSEVLIDAAKLRPQVGQVGQAGAPMVLDVRWSPEQPDGRAAYRAGHIPGAAYVSLADELSGPPSMAAGRHPLPELVDLQAHARAWGLREGQPVVVYDDADGFGSARAWWLLKWAGVRRVHMLDGGLNAWREIGGELATGDEDHIPGTIRMVPDQMSVIDADGVVEYAQSGVLIDAREPDQYRGQAPVPAGSRAGHIPGAINLPTLQNLTTDRRFRPMEELRAHFAQAGVGESVPVAVYCETGISATQQIAALSMLGVDAALYPGSWAQWAADPERPITTD